MSKTFLRFTLLLGLLVFSARVAEPISVPSVSHLVDKKTASESLSFSVCDQNDTHAFLSSPKEDGSTQFSQQKTKFIYAHASPGVKLNYRFIHILYQSVLAHSFILGGTTALRAPPTV